MHVRPQLVQVERRAEEVRTPGERFPGVDRLLVVRDDRLGDLVVTIPAVAALRRTYPEATLGLVVRPDLAPLARMVEGVDRVVDAERMDEFDPQLLISVSPGSEIPRRARKARIEHRVGPGYRLYSPLFHRTVNERRSAGLRHEAEYALSFAHRAGAPAGPACFPIRIPDDLRQRARDWLAASRVDPEFVLLHPGSGGSCPPWPCEHFLRLAGLLQAQGVSIVFSVGPDDAEIRRALEAGPGALRDVPCFDGALTELTALLRLPRLVVSNSTGPLHLAAAVGTPTLGVYPPWPTCHPSRWGPYAGNGWALVAWSDEAVRWSRGQRRGSGAELMRSVPPERVADRLFSLLKDLPRRHETR